MARHRTSHSGTGQRAGGTMRLGDAKPNPMPGSRRTAKQGISVAAGASRAPKTKRADISSAWSPTKSFGGASKMKAGTGRRK